MMGTRLMRCLSKSAAISPSETSSDAETTCGDMISPTVRPWDLENFFRQDGAWGQRLQPPRPLLVRSSFRAPDEVRLADHSDHRAGIVDHRQRADVMFDQKLDRVPTSVSGLTVTTSRTITSIAFMVSSHNARALRWRRLPMCQSRSSAAGSSKHVDKEDVEGRRKRDGGR